MPPSRPIEGGSSIGPVIRGRLKRLPSAGTEIVLRTDPCRVDRSRSQGDGGSRQTRSTPRIFSPMPFDHKRRGGRNDGKPCRSCQLDSASAGDVSLCHSPLRPILSMSLNARHPACLVASPYFDIESLTRTRAHGRWCSDNGFSGFRSLIARLCRFCLAADGFRASTIEHAIEDLPADAGFGLLGSEGACSQSVSDDRLVAADRSFDQ